jgi:nicotinamide mononucleotide adenylyltransferase
MSSQPYELQSDQSDDPLTRKPIKLGFIDHHAAEAKRREFEEYIYLIKNTLITATPYATQEQIETLDPTTIKFYYFIGRCNPPHKGHIAALIELCRLAHDSGVPALILLGSGPAGERLSFSNPLTFEEKSKFILEKLKHAGYVEVDDFIFQEMKSPYIDVPDFVFTGLGKMDTFKRVEVMQLAGDKGDDTTKLAGVLKAVEKKIAPIIEKSGASFSGEVNPFAASASEQEGVAMSATEVRKKALSSYSDANFDIETGFSSWPEEFQRYYGINMYKAIVSPATELLEDKSPEYVKYVKAVIEEYILNETLPKPLEVVEIPTKKPRKRKGGSKRRNKKSHKRRPNKTQKRKRKTRRIK